MGIDRKLPIAGAFGFLIAACASAHAVDTHVQSLIDKTRNTRATYALYSWNVITKPGEKEIQEWSAEFHQETKHRVETPRDRLIADCATMEGTYLEVATKEIIRGPQVARAACGIQANSKIESARILGDLRTRFGLAQQIEIVDPEYIRTYDISSEGILFGATISDKGDHRNVLVRGHAVAVEKTLPARDIFSEESLNQTFVHEKYRTESLAQ